LEKDLAHHRKNLDEKTLKYKLEVYQKKFQICFVAIQQVWMHRAKMGKLKQKPTMTTQEEEV
jgi:hypothetical protein